MPKVFKYIVILILQIIATNQLAFSQVERNITAIGENENPLLSGVHTLSIHVKDTTVFESVYQLLAEKLMLPVYYYPLRYHDRKYAGLYAGNMVLEPCGPYKDIDYANKRFEAILYGLNFELNNFDYSTQYLSDRQIPFKVNQEGKYVEITDSILRNNTYLSLIRIDDKEKRDSLRGVLNSNKAGIEYVKEITVGYSDDLQVKEWEKMFAPKQIKKGNKFCINDSLNLNFIKSNFSGPKSIVLKIKSIEMTKQYLNDQNLLGSHESGMLWLDQSQTSGLKIAFTEKKIE